MEVLRTSDNSELMLFAVSMCAWRPSFIDHGALVVFGGTREGAQRAGLKEARKLWPASDGWQGHDVQVRPVEVKLEIEKPFDVAPDRSSSTEFLM